MLPHYIIFQRLCSGTSVPLSFTFVRLGADDSAGNCDFFELDMREEFSLHGVVLSYGFYSVILLTSTVTVS